MKKIEWLLIFLISVTNCGFFAFNIVHALHIEERSRIHFQHEDDMEKIERERVKNSQLLIQQIQDQEKRIKELEKQLKMRQ